jgi:hypothetical protein
MKTNITSTAAAISCTVLLSLATYSTANASLAQYGNQLYANDFSSLTDAGWTHMSTFALSSGQTWNASSGAYRMTALANGYNPGNGSYGFVGSTPTGLTFANGYVQSDVVAWQGPGAYGAFGVGSRLGNLGVPLGLTGYAIVYEPYGNTLQGNIRLERLGPPSIFNNLGSQNVALTPGNQYAFTLETTGSSIVGSLWNVGQVGTSLVGQVSATDATYASGAVALFGVCQQPIAAVDTTWDNFIVMVPEPATGALLGLGLLGFLAARTRRLE